MLREVIVMTQIIQSHKRNNLVYKKRHRVQYILSFLIIGLLLISCSSTPPLKQEVQESGTQEEPLPQPAQIRFDPTGSDSGNIEGLYTVYFGYDQSTLTDETKQKLSQNAD